MDQGHFVLVVHVLIATIWRECVSISKCFGMASVFNRDYIGISSRASTVEHGLVPLELESHHGVVARV